MTVEDEQGDVVVSESQELTLGPGEDDEVVFEDVEVGDLDPGEYTHEVSSDDDEAAGSLTVLAGGILSVAIDEDDSELEAEEDNEFSVVVDVENTGDTDLTQDIVAEVDDEERDTEADVEVSGGDTVEVTLTFDAQEGDDGQDVVVSSDGDSDTATLIVEEPGEAEFEVQFVDQDSETIAGEEQTFNVEIENVGDEIGEQTITLDCGDGTHMNSTEVTVESGETAVEELSIQTDADEFVGIYRRSRPSASGSYGNRRFP